MTSDKPPKRILFVGHSAQLSGGELALLALMPSLNKQVETFMLLGEEGPLVERLERAGTKAIVEPLPGFSSSVKKDEAKKMSVLLRAMFPMLKHVVRTTRTIRRLQPDVVYTNSMKAHLYAGIAGRLARVPVVWHVRDTIAAPYLSEGTAKVVRFLAKRIPRVVIANSRHTLRSVAQDSSRGYVLNSSGSVRMRLSSRDAAPKDLVIFGITGRLLPWKGQELFLEALARVKETANVKVEGVIVGAPLLGDQDFEQVLRDKADELDLTKQVTFRGFRSDMSAELERIDVLVHASSIPEPFGQVAVEGLNAGIPVIAADSGGVLEIVEEGRTGWFFKTGSSASLSEVMSTAINSADLFPVMSKEALLAAEKYAPELLSDAMLKILNNVLSSARLAS